MADSAGRMNNRQKGSNTRLPHFHYFQEREGEVPELTPAFIALPSFSKRRDRTNLN